ncbi:MAG: hypothetical protein QOD76_1545 [Solirubrobacteraceae bacterium]|nr:hypothetical protein [Solirubrobacteraceae bacterium]
MRLPRSLQADGEAHDEASEKLDAAIDDQARLRDEDSAAKGSSDELGAGVRLAAADEKVAAREAWVKYVEHGY